MDSPPLPRSSPRGPAPFLVEVTVPEPLTAVASGRPVGEPTVDAAAGTRTFRYEQRLPVMAYLVAVCCGGRARGEEAQCLPPLDLRLPPEMDRVRLGK